MLWIKCTHYGLTESETKVDYLLLLLSFVSLDFLFDQFFFLLSVFWWSSTAITVIGQWLHQSNLLEPIENAIGDCFFRRSFFLFYILNKWIHFFFKTYSIQMAVLQFHVKWTNHSWFLFHKYGIEMK